MQLFVKVIIKDTNFQANWNVNADDFAGMLTKSLSQNANLLASINNFPADEELKHMLI